MGNCLFIHNKLAVKHSVVSHAAIPVCRKTRQGGFLHSLPGLMVDSFYILFLGISFGD